MRLKVRPRYALLVALLWLTGCAQLPAKFEYRQPPAADSVPVWPPAPDQARYRYVGQLTGEKNFRRPAQEAGDWLGRVGRWLAGLVGHDPNPVVLQRPQAVVSAPDGRVLVSDISRQAIYVFDRPGGRLLVWEYASDELRFMIPVGLALGDGGALYVADAGLKAVVKLDLEGNPVRLIGQGQLRHPAGVAYDPQGQRLYVSDRGDNDIKVFSPEGALISSFGRHGEQPGELNGPTYLTWDGQRLLVTDTLNSRIQIYGPDGRYLSGFGRRGLYLGDLPRPKGVAVGPGGTIYVVESYYDYLLIFNRKGEFLLPIGGSGKGIGQFYLPAGVWADGDGYVYVADMFNGRVMVFEYIGEVNGADTAETRGSADVEHAGG